MADLEGYIEILLRKLPGKLAKKPPTEAALTGLPFEHRHFNLVGQDCEMTCEAVE